MSFTSQSDQEPKPCACTQSYRDHVRAALRKRDWLRKTTCPSCKEYWTTRESDYRFECESRVSTEGRVS